MERQTRLQSLMEAPALRLAWTGCKQFLQILLPSPRADGPLCCLVSLGSFSPENPFCESLVGIVGPQTLWDTCTSAAGVQGVCVIVLNAFVLL